MSFGTKRARSKLSNRLTAIYATLFTVLLLLLSIGVFVSAYEFLVQKQIANLSITLELIADHLIEEIEEGDSLSNPEVLQEQNNDPNLTIFVFDNAGNMINRVLNFPISLPALPKAGPSPVLFFDDGHMRLAASWQISEAGTAYGSLGIVQNLQNETDFLRLLGLLLIGANGIGAVAALLVGRTTSRRMLAPIGQMIAAANQIGSSTLDVRLDVPEPDDELKSLARTVNGMLDRVSAAYHQQGRFVADVSHELRTPLAVMQGNVDLLARWGAADKTVLTDSIQALQRQTSYMNDLVENLLFLARCDNAQSSLHPTMFSAGALFCELIEEQALIDPIHAYAVEALPQDDDMTADRAMIKQMLRALIDNSVKYTPEHGGIALGFSRGEGFVSLRVSDNGAGMEQEDCAHIFERFYRADPARTRASGGTGLGLSIVLAIAQAHGGTAFAESAPGEGTAVTIVIPD